jgi:transposase-like protein
MKTVERKFTPEFKIEAVKLWEASGRRSKETGEQLGIRPELLNQWKHALERQKTNPARCPNTQATGSFSDAGPEAAAEIARLRRELTRVKMEHEILKKTVGILSEITK